MRQVALPVTFSLWKLSHSEDGSQFLLPPESQEAVVKRLTA